MKKILISIQGKTLILHYQVRQAPPRSGSGRANYIAVLPSTELSRFNLKGLTPDMFCVNISDAANNRGLLSGTVENEQQIAVARWEIDEEDYRQAISDSAVHLTHLQIVNLLESLPQYVQQADGQFIDFEARVVPHADGGTAAFSGFRLTIVTEDIGDKTAPYAYFNLDVHTADEWQGYPPPQADFEPVKAALAGTLQAISAAGVRLTQVYDESDYAIAS